MNITILRVFHALESVRCREGCVSAEVRPDVPFGHQSFMVTDCIQTHPLCIRDASELHQRADTGILPSPHRRAHAHQPLRSNPLRSIPEAAR